MLYNIKLEKFEGPLDLLLQLIEKEKLDITKVSLATITEEYLEYLKKLDNLLSDDLTSFIYIAAKLLYLKSRTLLPYLEFEEEEDGGDLEEQLKIYQEYLKASKNIQEIALKERFSFSRKYVKPKIKGFNPPKNINKDILYSTFNDILKNIEKEREFRLPEEKMQKTLSITDKISEIKNIIFKKSKIQFSKIIENSKSKVEIITSFLALLELIKQQVVLVDQNENCKDMFIKKV